MAETLTIRTASSTEVVKIAVQGPQGPKGDKGDPGDVAGLPLTTQGDTLYRGASENQRLPIGTSGQILKVSAGGIPEWAAAPATGVTSVTGTAPIASSGGNTPTISISAATTSAAGSMSAADKLKLDGIAAGAEVNVNADWNASSGDAEILNKPASFTPSTHGSTHHTGGTDALAAHQINGQTIFSTASATYSTDQTLTANRARQFTISNTNAGGINVTLPTGADGTLNGDTYVVIGGSTISGPITIRRINVLSPLIYETLATITATGQQYRFRAGGGSTGGWVIVPVDTHTHAASAITSGTLAHERGGLEADVSAYSGLVKISGGSTSAVTVTAAGEALLDDATNADQRTTLGLGTGAVANLGTGASDAAYGNHTHGNITNGGLVGTVANLPLKTGTGGIVEAGAFGTSAGQFAEGNDSRITGAIQSTLVDAKGDLIVGTAADTVARLPVGATNGHVLTVDSAEAGGMKWAAASGGVSAVDATLADVMSVSGSNLVADDGGLVDSSNPALVWDDAAGKAVWANPLRRTSAGAFYVGVAPTTTALGTNAVNIQPSRALATQVASGLESVNIGVETTAGTRGVAIGWRASAGGATSSTAVGRSSNASGQQGTAIGTESGATAFGATAIGNSVVASAQDAVAIGSYDANDTNAIATAIRCVGLNAIANMRGMLATRPFNAVYWGGQTTSDTANVELNLDATATNRMVIAANTAVIADIFLIARRTDNTKFLSARRWVAIRRDGSNNTALIGAVQTLGTDQSEGSPTWTFTIDADDTASVESLRVRVTGAASETVNWRVCAIYRVVA